MTTILFSVLLEFELSIVGSVEFPLNSVDCVSDVFSANTTSLQTAF